jgi:hypothetical protein
VAKVILDRVAGKFESFIYTPASTKIRGKVECAISIRTSDGEEYASDIVIMAASARTHKLVSRLERILNTTGANIVHVKVPADL